MFQVNKKKDWFFNCLHHTFSGGHHDYEIWKILRDIIIQMDKITANFAHT